MKVKCLAQEHNTMIWPGLKLRLISFCLLDGLRWERGTARNLKMKLYISPKDKTCIIGCLRHPGSARTQLQDWGKKSHFCCMSQKIKFLNNGRTDVSQERRDKFIHCFFTSSLSCFTFTY